MLNDFINLTQGQLVIKYWYVWIVIILIATLSLIKDKN